MDTIDRIRAFSRFYTERLGLLSRRYLDTGLGLTEARLLHELGEAEGREGGPSRKVGARELARGLRLDEGQVSRVLAGFEGRGWLRRKATSDARRRALHLTPEGHEAVRRIAASSRASLAELLAPLPPPARDEVAAALDRVRALLAPGTAGPAALRDLRPGDLGWVVERHGALYAVHEGYDAGFEGLVAEIVAGFAARADARERGWIAARALGEGHAAAEERLGCIFVMAEGEAEPEVARLRLVLLEPHARGTGLAQAMLDAALSFAREAGYARMRLWTHQSHQAAGRLYARNGFALLASAPARAYGQEVVEETWERVL